MEAVRPLRCPICNVRHMEPMPATKFAIIHCPRCTMMVFMMPNAIPAVVTCSCGNTFKTSVQVETVSRFLFGRGFGLTRERVNPIGIYERTLRGGELGD